MTEKSETKIMSIIPMEKFGKDHWSLLAYVEVRCVDHDGQVVHDHMRTNPDRNPDLGFRKISFGSSRWKDEYSTRLKGFPWKNKNEKEKAQYRVSGHDDWDCLEDLEKAGFIKFISYANGFVQMTEAGSAMVGEIRTHKGQGGGFANFVPGPKTNTIGV